MVFVGSNQDVDSDLDVDAFFVVFAVTFEHVAREDVDVVGFEMGKQAALGGVKLFAFRILVFNADGADVVVGDNDFETFGEERVKGRVVEGMPAVKFEFFEPVIEVAAVVED